MKKYLVTGATGFIGGPLSRLLVQEGHKVVAPVRNPAKAKDLSALGIELHQADITDKDSLRPMMADIDGIFHLAAWYKIGTRNQEEAKQINIDGTRNVLELMQEFKIKKGVYTSTLAINSDTKGVLADENYYYDGHHLSIYDQTKWQAHYEVAEPMMKAGLPLVIVMPGLVYGPGDQSSVQKAFIQYLQNKLKFLPEKTAFSWGYIDDITKAHYLAMINGQPGEKYIIAGPTHTLIEAFAMAEQITKIPAPKFHLPPWMMHSSAVIAGLAERFIKLPAVYSAEGLRVTAGVTYTGNNSKAKKDLGYDPRPLQVGLTETLQYELRQLIK